MEIKSLTITQYLIQGDPEGLVAAYASNWTGQCLKFPRNLFQIARNREEFKRPGIYFLIGRQSSEIDTWEVYVGESEGLDIRLGEHDRDLKKEFLGTSNSFFKQRRKLNQRSRKIFRI